MQALSRKRLHLAPELLSKCSKAMHLRATPQVGVQHDTCPQINL